MTEVFIRKTCTGTVEEQISDESGDYLRVDTEEDGLLDFRLTDSTEFTDDAAVSAGDTVEVDYVPWYATDTCNALVVTLVG